jgi:glutathione S-transferase
MLTIYGRDYSSNVQMVMWAVGELGLAHERLDYGHVFGKVDTPEFLEMNPNGLVPVLKDGGLVMFESAAIVRYLAARYGDRRFWPADAMIRGPLDTWAEWAKNSFAPAVNQVFYNSVVVSPARRNPEALAAAEKNAARLALMLDERLGEGPYLADQTFTFADLSPGHILYRYYNVPFARPATPGLDAYWQRLQERPAFAKHAMKSFESLRGKD